MKSDISLVFLQGLGNSIINFPIYLAIARHHRTQVITFKNGSASFYKAWGADVSSFGSLKELILKSYSIKCDHLFSFFPNWRRELLANLLIRASYKNFFLTKPWLNIFFLGHPLPTVFGRHDNENNLEILKKLEIAPLSTDEIFATLKIIRSSKKYAVVHPTASTIHKYYPEIFWKQLLEGLADEFEEIHIIAGSANIEVEFIQKIKQPQHIIHIGKSFVELASLLASCSLFVGLDSSMMHYAAIFDRRIVALWSFANYRRIYPYTSDAAIYLPFEVLDAKDFKYPSYALPYVKRANSGEVLRIIRQEVSPSFVISDQRQNDIKIYQF
jgi:ADP-heptose:LPS heptosyltransferase